MGTIQPSNLDPPPPDGTCRKVCVSLTTASLAAADLLVSIRRRAGESRETANRSAMLRRGLRALLSTIQGLPPGVPSITDPLNNVRRIREIAAGWVELEPEHREMLDAWLADVEKMLESLRDSGDPEADSRNSYRTVG